MNPLNLEAAVCSLCARCVLAVCSLLGRVVAGHFWCSYAWVSLTNTERVRPRGCALLYRARAGAGGRARFERARFLYRACARFLYAPVRACASYPRVRAFL